MAVIRIRVVPTGAGEPALLGLGLLIGAILASSPATPPAPANPAPQPVPAPVPPPPGTPVPTPDGNAQHRGRLQIQGKDLRQEVSWPWAQSTPPKKTTALAELTLLWNQLLPGEQQLRTRAYSQAQNFIKSGPHYQGRPRTFQNPNLPAKNRDARIDIEIIKGEAFAN